MPASAHDWYQGLRLPSGIECCGERDCRRVPYRSNPASGHEEIEANGRWWPVEYDKVLNLPTPDGEVHACWRNPRGRPTFRCIILPGMAGLTPDPARSVGAVLAARARAAGR
ncbi:MAG: hypothetical protein ACJ8H8_00750 [Geminicoccaceae bacterium]